MQMTEASCIFCKIARHEIPAKTVFEDNEMVAFEDLRPQAPVHILVIPKRHIARISDLTEDDSLLAGKLVTVANAIARSKKIHESGYRVVLNCNKDAGQEVFHIHAHLLGGRRFSWPPG